MPKQIPILFLGDAPTLPSGLGRIGRDLATLAGGLPEFRVGFLGRGGITDARLPFVQYNYTPKVGCEWGSDILPEVWENFAAGDHGIIFTIWDATRLGWFGAHATFDREAPGYSAKLHRFIATGHERFDRWGYFPVDATGSQYVPERDIYGALGREVGTTLMGYDRVLGYTEFGASVLEQTMTANLPESLYATGFRPKVGWIPHGMDPKVWRPDISGAEVARVKAALGFQPDELVVGCVMTNQPRKDWYLWAATCALLMRDDPTLRFWAHIDSPDFPYWDLRTLLDDFGLWEAAKITSDVVDDQTMAARYRACDVTFLPSLGEGFGYPIVESQMCGVPCVHGGSGGGASLTNLLVAPRGWRGDTRWNLQRPIYDGDRFARKVRAALDAQAAPLLPGYAMMIAERMRYLHWAELWRARWKPWFLEGIGAWTAERRALEVWEAAARSRKQRQRHGEGLEATR